MEGTEQNEEELEQIPNTAEQQDYYENDLEEKVDQDLEDTIKSIKKAKLRRAAPPTSAPSELWRLILCPA
eukprot:539124-Pyramimonas_sp.AAC.1